MDFSLEEGIFEGLILKKVVYTQEFPPSEGITWSTIIIHHTGNTTTLEGMYDLHVIKNGWKGIGYHFVVDENGIIYQTRELNREGAHAKGFNTTAIGIALARNLDEKEPTTPMKEQTKKLVSTLLKKYPLTRVIGHSSAQKERGIIPQKTCPGKNTALFLKEVQQMIPQ